MHSRGINRGETLGNPVGRFEGVGSKKDNGHKSAVWLVDIDFETPRTSSSGSVAGMVKGWGGVGGRIHTSTRVRTNPYFRRAYAKRGVRNPVSQTWATE